MKQLLILVTALWTVGCANLIEQPQGIEERHVIKVGKPQRQQDDWQKKLVAAQKQQDQDEWKKKLEASKIKIQEQEQQNKIESEQLYMMGLEYFKKNELENAKDSLEKSISLWPDNEKNPRAPS